MNTKGLNAKTIYAIDSFTGEKHPIMPAWGMERMDHNIWTISKDNPETKYIAYYDGHWRDIHSANKC